MASIEFIDVHKFYGETPALVAFDFVFPAQKITAVVGRSGSGKSTLLQLINGLERPSRGRIRVHGEPIAYDRLPEFRRQFGYAVQGTGLFPHLTIEQNVRLPGRLVGRDDARAVARCRELMELVNLAPELGQRYPHELSGGQQQRVGLCRAMFLNPAIFLFDEPFGALDPITRSEIHEELLRLQRLQPRTILLVTHDVREAVKLADQILILDAGRLVQAGTREDIWKRPATPFVESLIRSQLEL